MKYPTVLVLASVLLTAPACILASGSLEGGTTIKNIQWFTSDNVHSTDVVEFVDMPETYVNFETKGKSGDAVIHFCAMIDNDPDGGRTTLRVLVDDAILAEPNLEPGVGVAWDHILPTSKCMMWVAPGIESGMHTVQVQWLHEYGTRSRVSYRTLAVYY